MMNKARFISLFFATIILLTSCQRNYYSGTGKKASSGCGCPGTK